VTIGLALSGCAQTRTLVDAVGNAISVVGDVAVGVANPVTTERLYQFENGMIVAFAGLNAYKVACVRGVIPRGCRATIAHLQTYTRQIPAQLRIVRAFVKDNDQVNAVIAYNTLTAMFTEFKAEATANNVKVE
jgi:hypothetical protein